MQTTVKLNNCAHSPRKMRLLADLVRGMQVDKALFTLKMHPKKMYSIHLEKLLRSAIASWNEKYSGERMEDHGVVITMVKVDGARVLKRVQPAPQGRANRVRSRYNHITMTIAPKGWVAVAEKAETVEANIPAPVVEEATAAEVKKKTTRTRKPKADKE